MNLAPLPPPPEFPHHPRAFRTLGSNYTLPAVAQSRDCHRTVYNDSIIVSPVFSHLFTFCCLARAKTSLTPTIVLVHASHCAFLIVHASVHPSIALETSEKLHQIEEGREDHADKIPGWRSSSPTRAEEQPLRRKRNLTEVGRKGYRWCVCREEGLSIARSETRDHRQATNNRRVTRCSRWGHSCWYL